MMSKPALQRLAADIVIAYSARHRLAHGDVGRMIAAVGAALQSLGTTPPALPPTPAVPINRSIQHTYLVCLENGRRRKLLKRYLRTAFQLTPEQYRARWGLPSSYPMVAPAYASARSRLARQCGLGRTGRGLVQPTP